MSSKQRIISHLITTHGKEDLEKGKKQNLQSRTTLWRRKRSADGSFIHEQCSSISNFQDEVSPPNLESCSAVSDQSVPHAEGLSSSLAMFTQENIGGVLDGQKELNYVTEPPEMSWQDKPSYSNKDFYYMYAKPQSNDNNILSTGDLSSSDTDLSTSNSDESSSETEETSSEDSDLEFPEDKLETAQ